jgi:hypothetical protein
VDPSFIYVTTLAFFTAYLAIPPQFGVGSWTVTNMQINLSTTPKNASTLSTNFAQNVGPDDTIVFGPRSLFFAGGNYISELILLDRPFRYDLRRGNLLLDVRIFVETGGADPPSNTAEMDAYSSPTDETARVWAYDVNATSANGSDTTGLFTVLQFSPVPTLTNYTSTFGTPTNFIVIDWPTQPTVFVLQRSARIGTNALWETLTNAGTGPNASLQRYFFPANSSGSQGFYRLVWPGGQ